jgi:hypothetical protein
MNSSLANLKYDPLGGTGGASQRATVSRRASLAIHTGYFRRLRAVTSETSRASCSTFGPEPLRPRGRFALVPAAAAGKPVTSLVNEGALVAWLGRVFFFRPASGHLQTRYLLSE